MDVWETLLTVLDFGISLAVRILVWLGNDQ